MPFSAFNNLKMPKGSILPLDFFSAFAIEGTTVKVAFSDPLDEKSVSEVKLLLVNQVSQFLFLPCCQLPL